LTLQLSENWKDWPPEQKEAMLQRLRTKSQTLQWPQTYRNVDTRRPYLAHSEEELAALQDDTPRYVLAKGGEGGGKSVFGVVKDLERLKRGMSGIMVSPDLPHFKKSLWPEFRRWCPWDQVVPAQRYRGAFTWEPNAPFSLAFQNGTILYCGGIDSPIAWEGPNVNFAHLDEARRKTDASALKVLDGRVRIPGPKGEPPQLWITTTPKKNWLWEYFGPLRKHDPRADFKQHIRVITLLTKDNEVNLENDFVAKRSLTLNATEVRVLLEAEWESLDDIARFVDEMVLWDRLKEPLPPLGPNEPVVFGLDAGVSHASFGLVGVTRHPNPKRHEDTVAIRYVRNWVPPAGGKIDFQGTEDRPGPERIIRQLAEEYAVVSFVYDPWQLHDMAQRLTREEIGWFYDFSQGVRRLEADRQLLDLILERRLAHDGNPMLREHFDNSDRKQYEGLAAGKVRIVQREKSLHVDLAVCTAMASHACLRLQL